MMQFNIFGNLNMALSYTSTENQNLAGKITTGKGGEGRLEDLY